MPKTQPWSFSFWSSSCGGGGGFLCKLSLRDTAFGNTGVLFFPAVSLAAGTFFFVAVSPAAVRLLFAGGRRKEVFATGEPSGAVCVTSPKAVGVADTDDPRGAAGVGRPDGVTARVRRLCRVARVVGSGAAAFAAVAGDCTTGFSGLTGVAVAGLAGFPPAGAFAGVAGRAPEMRE